MALTTDDVLHLAQLCRIDLSTAEVERYAAQLSSILDYVGQLAQVDVDVAREAIASITGLENVLRTDEVHACSTEERQRILNQFSMRDGDLLKTRGVFSG